MKLTDLNPQIEKHGEYEHLAFDCPVCKTHRIEIPIKDHPRAWGYSGEPFTTTTTTPSIAHECHYADGLGNEPRHCSSHFFITNGEIQLC